MTKGLSLFMTGETGSGRYSGSCAMRGFMKQSSGTVGMVCSVLVLSWCILELDNAMPLKVCAYAKRDLDLTANNIDTV